MKTTAFFLLLLLVFTGQAFAQKTASCSLQDEEYRVIAALLFPNEPDVPDRIKTDAERAAYVASATVDLQGVHGSSYSLAPSTIRQSKLEANGDDGGDAVLRNDYNRKNAAPCAMDLAKLKALLPEGKHVSFAEKQKLGEVSLGGGVTYVSRVGFNRARTIAIVAIRHIAGPEMGVGYRVSLTKSQKTGKWVITGAARNFIS